MHLAHFETMLGKEAGNQAGELLVVFDEQYLAEVGQSIGFHRSGGIGWHYMHPLPAKLQRLVRDRAAIGGSGRKHPGIRLHPGGVTSAFPLLECMPLILGAGRTGLRLCNEEYPCKFLLKSTSALERRMTVGVPAERIETEVNKRLQQTARRAKIPGFRPARCR